MAHHYKGVTNDTCHDILRQHICIINTIADNSQGNMKEKNHKKTTKHTNEETPTNQPSISYNTVYSLFHGQYAVDVNMSLADKVGTKLLVPTVLLCTPP